MSTKLLALLRFSSAAALIACSQLAWAQSANTVYSRVANSVGILIITTFEGELVGSGSAVTVGPQTMVTNRHVLIPGHRYMVLMNGSRLEAYQTMCDSVQDLCLISVKGLDSKPVEFGDVKKLSVGDQVYTLGYPNELGNVMGVSEATKQKTYSPVQSTLSNGLITALRPLEDGSLIQTNAAISPGSSGGGLFDANGRLIGITTFGMKYGQGLNMALPVNWVERLGVTGAPHGAEAMTEAVSQGRFTQSANDAREPESPSIAAQDASPHPALQAARIVPAAAPASTYKNYWWAAIPVLLIALFVIKRRSSNYIAETSGGTRAALNNDLPIEPFLEAAAKEVEEQKTDTALWAMVLSESKGNESIARESYIKYRAKKLRSIAVAS
jgi:serine protease Do